ncbi:zinc finger CCCH domain-containing protein 17-like [Bidens hawaiensis]|uniref:zinc finger CCCH domain-containing protein 17-like n=1 Tax=Bidens hawaiensis TaxID=980011 RepID=UPI00404A6009
MVGGTAHQQQQGSQLTHQSSEEDEVLKRNTDCVYFLASPLTCKKGSECEFRHSDAARVNPRDCWYWLNGNCLNPKCAFRHPPLDGLLGSDGATPMVPPASAPHATAYAVPKQGVACIYFQKGYCLKGPLCPFLHGPSNPVNNKPAQPGPNNTVTDPSKMPQQQKPVQKPVIEPSKMAQQVIVQKPVSLPARTIADKMIAPPARVGPPAVMNEPPSNKSNRGLYHGYQASNNERVLKEADEYSREPSPGFDVLVDNEVEDSGRYYDVDHADRVDRDMYREHRDYDRYNDRDGHFDVDHPEKRPYARNDRENELDLRQRLSKQRRGSDNGSRSVVNRESLADRIDRMPPVRDSRHDDHRRLDQGSLSSRLRGRIKIPGRSVSPTNDSNPWVEREIGMERRNLLRYSPERRLRVGDRLNDTKFACPKRLSELKGGRSEHQPKDEQLSGKRKHEKTEDGSSFEGPKSLSEILKRKRGVNNDNIANNNNNNNNVTDNTEDDTRKKAEIVSANEEKHNSVSVDLDAEKEKDKPLDGDSVNYEEEVGNEVDEDALLDEELEAYDENRDGDNEYEQMEGEEDYMEEGEEEYVDEEEYEKKENVVYS